MPAETEIDRIDRVAQSSLYTAGPALPAMKHCFKIFRRYMLGDTILELGPAEGLMTDLLVDLGCDLTVVEGSPKFAKDLRARHGTSLAVVETLFETFEPSRKFDNIIMGHVLEHVEDPVALLKRAGGWLTPDGRILSAVPNSRSLHRQAAVIMGILPFEEALNDMDRHHGHRRVYNPESFRRDFLSAGLKVEAFGGYFMKPVSNGQIEKSWSSEMLDAFLSLGERYPDTAAEIFVVANRSA